MSCVFVYNIHLFIYLIVACSVHSYLYIYNIRSSVYLVVCSIDWLIVCLFARSFVVEERVALLPSRRAACPAVHFAANIWRCRCFQKRLMSGV